MQVQLTNFAIAELNASTGPITLTDFKLGDGVNYVPLPTDTDIHGNLLFEGSPAAPQVINANIVKYSFYMDNSIGDFNFGEFGLYQNTDLFALGTASALIEKIKAGLTLGNSIRLDIYLSMVGTNYDMWFDVAESNNGFRIATLNGPDQLPPSALAVPNVYILQGADSSQTPIIAYTDRTSLWNFDCYQYITELEATIVGFDNQSVQIALTDYSSDIIPAYFGEILLEFITGPIYSICRYVKTVVVSGGVATLGFNTVLAATPMVGDKFRLFTRAANSVTRDLPIATASVLGGIKIGAGLIVAADGTCSIDPLALGLVTSVNGMVGDVVINAANLPGLAPVAISGNYNDLSNKPAQYSLPAMNQTLRGGAKLPLNNNLVITGLDVLDLGFAPIKTVNGVVPDSTGNVLVISNDVGLVGPTAIAATTNLNTLTTTGLFNITTVVAPTLGNAPTGLNQAATLEVVPLSPTGTGDSVQRLITANSQFWRKSTGTAWTQWIQVGTNAVATTTTLGVVQVGSGLAVDANGVLSTAIPNASASVAGLIKIGNGLAIDINGVVNVNYLPPAATTTSLGVVQVGSGLAVDSNGVLSTNFALATTTTPGVIKVGSGLAVAGDGTLSVNLPVSSTTVFGIMKVGTGLNVNSGVVSASVLTVNGVGPDGSGNIATTDPTKLNRIGGTAQGITLTLNDLGTVSAAITLDLSTSNIKLAKFTGGSCLWTLQGWPAAGIYGEQQAELTNGGLATHTFPASVNWILPNGQFTKVFGDYLTAQRAATNFQVSGTDFVIFFTRDGGTTVYARVL